MINETAQTILETTRGSIYSESLIISWMSFWLIMILVAFISKGRKKNWGNFWEIWLWTTIGSGLIILGFVLLPDFVSNIINSIKEAI